MEGRLDRYFEAFMQICFPDLHTVIDWSVAPTMLDKELQQIAPLSETGPRTVDKLVEVRLLTGDIEWLLIHLEVQSQRSLDFAERMFVYFYRIRDKYNRPIVSLAVLGDDDPAWRPQRYAQNLLGCRLDFEFPVVKLLDFGDRFAALEQSDNPFATVIMAHLMAMQTAGDLEQRCQWKLRLLRPLYQRGISADDVRELFRMVDWLMDLPSPTSLFFDSELRKIEQEYEMPYVTSIERRAIEQGIEQGFEKGVVFGQIQLLQRMLGIAEAPLAELRSQPMDALRTELERLQKQLASRQ